MNSNLQQLVRQLGTIWSQLGLNQRVSVVLAGAAVIGGLLGVAAWSRRVNYELLYGRLDDAEAARVVAALDEAKIPYKTGPGSIHVPSDKKYAVRMKLAAKGIPRNSSGVGFEVFDRPNFGLSDFVQRANYVRAIQGELSMAIEELDEVEFAKVMIVMPENRLLVDRQRHPTASVLIKTRSRTPMPQEGVNAIRFLVAASVEGLQPNHVSVVDGQGKVLSENSENDSMAGLTGSQLRARKELEQYLSKQAESVLIPVIGEGRVVVKVAADIDFDTVTRTQEVFDGENPVLRSKTSTTEDNDTTSSSSGGVAGVSSNSNTDTNNATGSPVTRNLLKKTITKQENEISKVTSNVVHVAGRIRRISAGVFVAMKVEGSGTSMKEVPRTQAEIDKLKRIVQSAIGIQDGSELLRKDEITLEEMPFTESPTVEIVRQMEKQEKFRWVTDMARSLAYPGLALAVLAAFWRSFKKTPIENIPLGVPVGHAGSNGGTDGGRFTGIPGMDEEPRTVTPEVLNRLIKENPDNMSQAIRNWLTKGKAPSK